MSRHKKKFTLVVEVERTDGSPQDWYDVGQDLLTELDGFDFESQDEQHDEPSTFTMEVLSAEVFVKPKKELT